MSLHAGTFEYLSPTDEQKESMSRVRRAAAEFADVLEGTLPEGPDKTFILRSLRTVLMWTNAAITREADGSPRE